MKAILSIAIGISTIVSLAACDVKKTAEGNITVPKYEKTQSGDVTLPKYDVTAPDVKVTKEEKTITVPTVKTEKKVIEVPNVSVTPARKSKATDPGYVIPMTDVWRHSHCPMRMASPIVISIPHQLGRAEARRRIEGNFTKFVQLLPGSSGTASERWDGDRLTFSVAALGQTISGVIEVLDAAVTMELQLPGFLSVIARGLKERLQEMGQLLLTNK